LSPVHGYLYNDGSLQDPGLELGCCEFWPLKVYSSGCFPIIQDRPVSGTKLTMMIFPFGPLSRNACKRHELPKGLEITTRDFLICIFHIDNSRKSRLRIRAYASAVDRDECKRSRASRSSQSPAPLSAERAVLPCLERYSHPRSTACARRLRGVPDAPVDPTY
jgi:hypothetical protein